MNHNKSGEGIISFIVVLLLLALLCYVGTLSAFAVLGGV